MTIIADVPNVDELLKSTIKRSQRRAKQITAKTKRQMIKKREIYKIESVALSLSNKLESIVKDTANFRKLSPFQKELCSALFDIDEVRRSLHSINWASKKILELGNSYKKKVMKTKDIESITRMRKQFEARVESILNKVKNDLEILKKAGIKTKQLPSIKELPTVVIAGYPNVGKSSILNALSDSKVKVEPYPFTTKQLLVGYAKRRFDNIQLIDTPGILDRPIEKMNRIERQALAALKHLGNNILFVLDASETCGFPIEKQLALLESIKRLFKPKLLVVVNKKDLITKDKLKGLEYDILISAKNKKDVERLKKMLFEII